MPGCPGIIPALPRCGPVVVHPFVNPVVNPLLNPCVNPFVAHHRHTLPDTSHSTKEHALAACWLNALGGCDSLAAMQDNPGRTRVLRSV